MKNNYAPVSDSDDSFKVLNDEKSDARSLDGTGTPPPYSTPNKFIDLEMADGSAQHSAQESTNNAGSDSRYSKWIRIAIFFFLHLLFAHMLYPGWYKQVGRVLSNMCAAVLCTASLNVPCYSVYYFVKKVIGFEKMDKGFFYFVCIVNVAVFVLFWSTDTRQLRIFIADLGNGMGNMVNAIGNGAVVIGNGADVIGNGIRNAANYFRPTDPENEAPRNEEIELQPLAEQSAEV
ncbi:uncharacterized protein SOCG_02960 [Schizosaccharomyces octosporus yFS286]|uniref:Uncharacterized protein n=1 Tax=Schizosaccharomyces octosporus (strain yFS286) TaxID=483514 RepID=S9Q0L9_SCHOY|nr:uncharacterized protein SOCG_02960 [Schizosaccharomyces octosporus yFS286]EPX73742.1 hypothetical protein SOCG_02960 [Schizosaccharomyces octosporus yFS286]